MKHAYLLMAHGNWSLLNRLIQKLDHKDNDIFLHIDKKANFPNEIEEKLRGSINFSNLFFCDRKKINWGGTARLIVNFVFLRWHTFGKNIGIFTS